MGREDCPCGSGVGLAECCGRVHRNGAGLGASAEQLMRARYSAYVLGDSEFLLKSWHQDTRPASIAFDPNLEWMGLEVVATEAGSALDSTGVVEFRARFHRGGENLELHERSRFERVNGRWVYLDAE